MPLPHHMTITGRVSVTSTHTHAEWGYRLTHACCHVEYIYRDTVDLETASLLTEQGLAPPTTHTYTFSS